ncbi:MAG: hypothetical protein GX592_03260 [Clostridiales bacterium]|nr:hypothetical protein [Clostridiales bacterium]
MGVRRWAKRNPAIRGVALRVRHVLGRAFMRLSHMTGVRRNRVLFSSFKGKGYSDSPRAISEKLHEIRPDAEITWQFREGCGKNAPPYIKAVRAHTLRALYAVSTARVLVDNFNRAHYMLKFSDQAYVQTWHGDRAFKKVLLDAYPDEPFPDGKQIDLAVAGSDYGERQYRSAFRYAGPVLKVGLPRNDLLVNPPEGRRDEIRRALGAGGDDRLLLYAPTFRDATRGGKQPCPFSTEAALRRLSEITGKRWICLARGHDMNSGVDCPGAVDVTGYPEMAELLLAADMLITDYSSSAGDFALTGRPVILYQADREAYVSRDRKLYFDVDDSPYWVARTEAELHALFEHLDRAGENCAEILEFYGASETGRAAGAVAEYVAARLSEGT